MFTIAICVASVRDTIYWDYKSQVNDTHAKPTHCVNVDRHESWYFPNLFVMQIFFRRVLIVNVAFRTWYMRSLPGDDD